MSLQTEIIRSFTRNLPLPTYGHRGLATGLYRDATTNDKRTALYPGGWHGWGIVETAPYAASARTLIAGWIRAHA